MDSSNNPSIPRLDSDRYHDGQATTQSERPETYDKNQPENNDDLTKACNVTSGKPHHYLKPSLTANPAPGSSASTATNAGHRRTLHCTDQEMVDRFQRSRIADEDTAAVTQALMAPRKVLSVSGNTSDPFPSVFRMFIHGPDQQSWMVPSQIDTFSSANIIRREIALKIDLVIVACADVSFDTINGSFSPSSQVRLTWQVSGAEITSPGIFYIVDGGKDLGFDVLLSEEELSHMRFYLPNNEVFRVPSSV